MDFSVSRHATGGLATGNLLPGESLTVTASSLLSYPASAAIEPITYTKGESPSSQLPGFTSYAPGRNILLDRITLAKGATESSFSLAPAFPGEITKIEMESNSLLIKASNFLACTSGINLTPIFYDYFQSDQYCPLLSAQGSGTILIGSYGGLEACAAGETATISLHALVCWQEQIAVQGYFPLKNRLSRSSSARSSLTVSGSGIFWMQSANIEKMIDLRREVTSRG